MQDTTVLEELIALEQAAMDPYFSESDPSTYAGSFASGATYFDPNSAGRIENDAILKHFAAFAGQIPPWRYEIRNPAVSVLGDAAVFTFNLETYDATDGSVTSRWNTTEVRLRTADGWEMVHAHWSHREPSN